MLVRPAIDDDLILACLNDAYGLDICQLTFLPLGADVNTAVFRAVSSGGTSYFLKLRKGTFDETSVAVPHYLKTQGFASIIAPLATRDDQLWLSLEPFKIILYPYIEGRDGYEAALSDAQWRIFGAALRAIHMAQLPAVLSRLIPRESFSPQWREMVKTFQAQVEETAYPDPVAASLAMFMKSRREEINRLVERAGELGSALQARPLELVLCHSDMHAGNLLLGVQDTLYIVDWDNLTYAPKERDLALVGGCPTWSNAREEACFYQGYGGVALDPLALVYYRYERIIQDIAAFCQQLLLTDEGGKDRAQSLLYFTGQFLPGHEVEIAFNTERNLDHKIYE